VKDLLFSGWSTKMGAPFFAKRRVGKQAVIPGKNEDVILTLNEVKGEGSAFTKF
jgi:hypothetical protein